MNRSRMLRAYPPAWLVRYGEEMEALIDDVLDGGRPTLRFRVSLLVAGLCERASSCELVGNEGERPDLARTGGLAVLWAWTVFVIAGCALAKLAEQRGSTQAIRVLTALALGAQGLVVIAALAAVPPVLAVLHHGGWRAITAHIRRALVATLLTVIALGGLVAWARTMPAASREHASWAYGSAFLATGAMVAACLAAWTGLAVAVAHRAPISPSALRVEARLAVGVTGAMAAMTGTVVVWCQSATVSGVVGLVLATMMAADVLAGYGVRRLRQFS